MNKFEQVLELWVRGQDWDLGRGFLKWISGDPRNRETYWHHLKHYLPATLLASGKKWWNQRELGSVEPFTSKRLGENKPWLHAINTIVSERSCSQSQRAFNMVLMKSYSDIWRTQTRRVQTAWRWSSTLFYCLIHEVLAPLWSVRLIWRGNTNHWNSRLVIHIQVHQFITSFVIFHLLRLDEKDAQQAGRSML